MALADLNTVPATSATSFEYKHNCIKFRETNMHCFFHFFAVTKPQKFERQSLSMHWAALSKPHLPTYFTWYSCCRNQIRGKEHSFNVVTGALQGALLIPFTFHLLQPFEVFSLDRTILLLHSHPLTLKTGSRSRTGIRPNAVSRLPALFHKIEVNLWTWCSSLYHSWETTA